MEDTMDLKFTVNTKIQKPVAEVFDAVYNPQKLKEYFATGSAEGALDEGTTAYWTFAGYKSDPIPVIVKKMEKNKRVVFEWAANEHPLQEVNRSKDYNTSVEMIFEENGSGETIVTITESGWRENAGALAGSYQNCNGWTNMLANLKFWTMHGLTLGGNCGG